MAVQRYNILGVGVGAIDMELALGTIDEWITRREPNYVCVTSVHGLIESQTDDELREIHNRAGLVSPDGMPLVWFAHLKGFRQVERVYGPDLMVAVCGQSVDKGYRHFLYGGTEEVLERLIENLNERFPGIKVVGKHAPPFRPLTLEEENQIVHLIDEANPDILWIGMSTPKQERWMAKYINRVNTTVLIGVGAAFDFIAGTKRQAPKWMQRNGLEWSFRLITEPRRLWRRYLKIGPLFLFLAFAQLMGLKRYKIISDTGS